MKKLMPLQSESEEEAAEEQFSHERLLKPCVLERVLKPVEPESDESSTRSIQLKPEDEISISSIISFLLGKIEPTEEEFKPCNWDLNAKDVLNEKNALLFDETLYISRLKNTNCKLSEYTKIFMERELEQVGKFCLGVEESYDGYVVLSKSQMIKGKDNCKCGHTLKGKYTDRFILICEKRTEYDFIDNSRVEKSLEVRNYYDEELVAYRETKVNEDSKKLKAVIKIKDSTTTFLCDGGVMLLMRYMIINNFIGSYEYYSMNLYGKILRCTLTVHYERKTVRIFYRTYKGCKRVITTHYFDDEPVEISETFLTAEGHIVLHFWHGYNYVLHHTCAPVKPPEKILPKLELMWKCDNVLFRNYQLKKKLNYQNAICYLSKHPEFTDLLQDYVQCLLKYKPVDVMRFTISFFHNMRTENPF